MIIKQKRIMNTSKLKFLEPSTLIRFGVFNLERFSGQLENIGFPKNLLEGHAVLPRAIGPVSKRNSEGDYIIHKDQEMETHYRMIEWTYYQWAGRGETIEVTDSVEVPYKRYPRTFIPPQSIELTASNMDGELVIISPEFQYESTNEAIIIHTINLFLEIFGECEILDPHGQIIKLPKIIRLNWEILPQGKLPWSEREKQVSEFIKRAKGTNQPVIRKRLKTVSKYDPDFAALGTAGFNGYIIFGFTDRNIYVLESIHVNNATYVLEDDWESISKLTKVEILNENLHKDRIIHAKNWYTRLSEVMHKNKID